MGWCASRTSFDSFRFFSFCLFFSIRFRAISVLSLLPLLLFLFAMSALLCSTAGRICGFFLPPFPRFPCRQRRLSSGVAQPAQASGNPTSAAMDHGLFGDRT
jgi:hypothetical protein